MCIIGWYDTAMVTIMNGRRATLTRLGLCIGILAALATIPALVQRTVDTIVTYGKILTILTTRP